ncbi:rRNA-processing protein CGR1 [Plectosphaerella plurivora]|uniref:rRNA-processing protein n=1 Tax=Plectosphaerella plurivora TaxID=936078 RepID=A0A9P9AD95_9PEZI|nr:rRNA-processing protein CGR1 [Plectosphaerella plurivora]
MSSTDTQTAPDAAPATTQQPMGMRVNGKQWHAPKKAFRPTSGLTSYEKRAKDRVAMSAMKAKEKEMKDEKEAARQHRIQTLRDKRAKKEEAERYEKMAEKMHRKRVDRLKRKEKRNKVLNS